MILFIFCYLCSPSIAFAGGGGGGIGGSSSSVPFFTPLLNIAIFMVIIYLHKKHK